MPRMVDKVFCLTMGCRPAVEAAQRCVPRATHACFEVMSLPGKLSKVSCFLVVLRGRLLCTERAHTPLHTGAPRAAGVNAVRIGVAPLHTGAPRAVDVDPARHTSLVDTTGIKIHVQIVQAKIWTLADSHKNMDPVPPAVPLRDRCRNPEHIRCPTWECPNLFGRQFPCMACRSNPGLLSKLQCPPPRPPTHKFTRVCQQGIGGEPWDRTRAVVDSVCRALPGWGKDMRSMLLLMSPTLEALLSGGTAGLNDQQRYRCELCRCELWGSTTSSNTGVCSCVCVHAFKDQQRYRCACMRSKTSSNTGVRSRACVWWWEVHLSFFYCLPTKLGRLITHVYMYACLHTPSLCLLRLLVIPCLHQTLLMSDRGTPYCWTVTISP